MSARAPAPTGAPAAAAAPDPPRAAVLRAAAERARGLGLATSMPYLYVVALGLVILLLEPALINGPGAVDVRFSAAVPLALVAFGQTLAMFTRGIDLAVGGLISMITAILATTGAASTSTLLVLLLVLVALGAAGGMVNGVAVAVTGLQPFIVTLATWTAFGGVALLILPQEGGASPPHLTTMVLGDLLGVPKSVWALVVLFALWWWMRDTRLVADLRAIGSDEQRARLIGVPIRRRTIQCYALSGVFAALAGIWIAAQTGSGAPTAGDTYILSSVAAVVIGGTSLFGGTGSAAASMAGAVAFLMIPDLIAAVQLSSFWSVFFQGALLIAAVTVSSIAVQLRARRGGA